MNYYKKVKPYRITLKAPDNATDIAKIQKKKKKKKDSSEQKKWKRRFETIDTQHVKLNSHVI